MLTLPHTRLMERGAKLPALLLPAIYTMLGIIQLQDYFPWKHPFFLLSVIAMVLVCRIDHTRRGSTRCGWIALFFLLLSWQLPVFTFRYAVLITALFFVIEYFYGRLQPLAFITATLIAPAIDFVINVFSFPIRLWLTGMAGKLLAGINPAVTTSGNMILVGNNEFSVDTACMGLQMMLTSLLCGVMLIALYQRRYQKVLPVTGILVILMAVTGLNIIANLFRIILLVQFALPPETMAHDAMGIAALVVYVILPLIPGTRWMLQRYGKVRQPANPVKQPSLYGAVLQLVLSGGIIGGPLFITRVQTAGSETNPAVKHLPGYSYAKMDDHIIKQTSADALLYVKGIPGFYFTDHQPMICWKGSGFGFYRIQEVNIAGTKVYTAELKKENSTLYTAWWYESRTRRSSSQLEWRWDALCSGNNYYLVNITVEKGALLEPEIRRLLSTYLIQ
ncbi:exosortase N [Chitinophaga sp. 22321]|uniref:Exosortase N n=1 Tax=Chitinophaga hostae TaxID=2831022 RepID=A0ABS5J2A9_9BACT|nr:exosortase N [Chitinophaga hostae]MBS0029181.1 exosortase N [Chitinophaga hostae]